MRSINLKRTVFSESIPQSIDFMPGENDSISNWVLGVAPNSERHIHDQNERTKDS